MSENKETVGKTLLVAFVLCVVCSSIVATSAVLLKPQQVAAREQDRIRNILQIGGLLEEGIPLSEQVKRVTPRVIDFQAGKYTDAVTVAQAVDPKKLTKSDQTSVLLADDADIAKIKRQERYGVVYVVEKAGAVERVILPIRGYGLWSTLWGFIALDADLNTVVGMGYYQHAETPGLGGEVDNPAWKALWPGKRVYEGDVVALHVIKGKSDPSSPKAVHEIDGLSGATLTSKGVDNMIKFWLGPNGYGAFLKNLKKGEA